MLNIGLIGNTKNFESHVKQIQKLRNINIVGKSSVGIDEKLNSFHFSIPEFNRIELIERAEVILIDNSSLLPFSLICDLIKKSKHIFATQYLGLSIDECSELLKLANEAGSVIQITNPYFFTPAISWINNNLATPTFLNISFLSASFKKDNLFQLLLMLRDITGINPKKIGAVSFHLNKEDKQFNNVRLEFGDASVVNLNYGNHDLINKFQIEAFSVKQSVKFNFREKTFYCNNKEIDLSPYSTTNEFNTFISTITNETKTISNLEDYLIALQTIQKIEKKISQFSYR